jgi:hypothetical protein
MARRLIVFTIIAAFLVCGLYAQDNTTSAAGLAFGAGMSLGADSIPVTRDGITANETWNVLGFQPDVAFGKFGVGLDLTLRFKLMPEPGKALEIYPDDWIPSGPNLFLGFLDIYLPKIQYVRYGLMGDPLYVKLGSIEDLTIGNGFLMANYANTRFLPAQRIFGISFRLDGELFKFPWVGIEFLTGNLARLDVIGSRLFARPLLGLNLPIIKNMQVGASFITDRQPELYYSLTNEGETALDAVFMYSADIMVPIISNAAFPLAVFTELGFQPNKRSGWMVGAGGRLAGFITYGAQLRLLGPGFIPMYFDPNYDLFRAEKARLMASPPAEDEKGFAGWFASLGTSLFNDTIAIAANVDGPFLAKPLVSSDNPALYPHLRAVANLGEGLLGGFSFNFAYDKYYLGRAEGKNFFEDLFDPNDAVITAAFNYSTGGAMFTLLYNLTYNPNKPEGENKFDITSSLSTSIKF